MKKFLLVLLLALLLPTVHMKAQDIAQGFYRVMWAGANDADVASLGVIGTELKSKDKIFRVAIDARKCLKINYVGHNTVDESDPSQIVQVTKQGDGYNMFSQGVDLKQTLNKLSLLPFRISLPLVNDRRQIKFRVKLRSAYLKIYADRYQIGNPDAYGGWWNFKPITSDGDVYFGVKPEVKCGDYYYTTLRTAFAYRLSEHVKAFIVTADHQLQDISSQEIIPAGLPVILRCESQNSAQNRLMPVVEKGIEVVGNVLVGGMNVDGTPNYFRFIPQTDISEIDAHVLKNVALGELKTSSNGNYRVLGVRDGKLGFFQTTWQARPNETCLNGNKAYLNTATDVIFE